MAITQGTWGAISPIFNFDYGVTEALFGNNAGVLSNPNQNKVLGASSTPDPFAGSQSKPIYGPTYTPPATKNSTATTGGSGGNVYNPLINSAQQQTDAELSRYLGEYDYNRANLEADRRGLDEQYANTERFYQDQEKNLLSNIETQTGKARNQADTNTQDALATAQETQRANRNMLRALGILNSTAAGEMLAKPLNQYDKVRAQINMNLTGRLEELDNFKNEKMSEISAAARDARNQYNTLVSKIQNDLRFNDRQRADAVRSANAALSERIGELKLAQAQWSSQINAAQTNIASAIEELGRGGVERVGTDAIAGTTLSNMNGGTNPLTASIYEDPRKRLTDLG